LRAFCISKEQKLMSDRAIRRAAERKANKAARKAAIHAATTNPLPSTSPAVLSKPAPAAIASPEISEPQPPSSARLAANRANSLLSTGPRTAAGKATVALNAVKTGLTGRTVVLPSDDAAQYQALVLAYEKEFQPVGPEECALVQSIADIRWRLARIPALEMALISLGRIEFDGLFHDHAHVDRGVMLEMHTRLAYQKDFRNLHLQESRLTRRREKEMAELLELQQTRKAKEAAALDLATNAYLLARHRSQSFDLAAFGFDFSDRKFDAHLAALTPHRKEILLQKALAEDISTMQAAA
jgi:hypothetical protein